MLVLRYVVVMLLLCLFWQLLVVGFQLPAYLLPSPIAVAKSMVNNYQLLLSNLVPTVVETVVGLLLGILLGMSVALLMMAFRFLRYWMLPIVIISQAIPTFAIAPLLVLWFGYGITAKVMTVMLMLFFPVASAFYDGLANINPDWLDMAAAMNAKKLAVLRHLRLPAAMPSLGAGIRVAVVLAPIGAVVSEWIGASQGLGFLMLNANARLQIDLMFASLILIMALALLLYAITNRLLIDNISW